MNLVTKTGVHNPLLSIDYNPVCQKLLTEKSSDFYRQCVVMWRVDLQKDFVNPKGRLAVPNAKELKPKVHQLTNFASDHHIPMLGSMDLHKVGQPDYKPDGSTFPEHCTIISRGKNINKLSRGAELIPQALGKYPFNIIFNSKDVNEYYTRCINDKNKKCSGFIAKTDYNVFSKKDIMASLVPELRGKALIIDGVATDWCVQAAVNGFLNTGIKPIVVIDAIRGINPVKSKQNIENIEKKGAILTTTKELLAKLFR